MRVPLLGGAYLQPGLIAAAQRSVNLYPETNPQEAQAPVNVTHYPRPGLTPLGFPPAPGHGRGLYTASNDKVYAVIDQDVFYVDPDFRFNLIGSLLTSTEKPVSIADNGTTAIIVDGDLTGSQLDINTNVVGSIGDPNFRGGTRVDFLDYFLFLNQPDSLIWYCSLSQQAVFNGLFYGQKTASADNIQVCVAIEREVWVLGRYFSEIWYNAGTVPFPFQPHPGVIIEHGCIAPYSAATIDVNLYWLSQAKNGARMVMKGLGKGATRVSTHALEAELLKYLRVDDAIGSTYQIKGHNFYRLHFPTADRTWTYDEATKQWHEEAWYDGNGVQHRARNTLCTYGYGKNLGLDWNNGTLYHIDQDNFTDNGQSIVCVRSMPHMLDNDNFSRQTYWKLIADIAVGTGSGTAAGPITTSPFSLGFSPGFGPQNYLGPPLISARMSKTRGASWGNMRMMPMGAAGLYKTTPTWNRWGECRDAVFELSWATPMQTALNGVFVEFEKHEADI